MFDVGVGSAEGLGNALRVGNENDVRTRLSAVLCEPDATAKIGQANFLATQHVPWDNEYHGAQDRGVMQIVTNDQLHTVDIFNNDTQSLVRPPAEQDKAFGKLLNNDQLGAAENLGNALRVGNEPDIQQQLPGVFADPDARQIVKNADFIATQHAPWDFHGPNGSGVETLLINPNNTIDLFNKDSNTVAVNNVAKLK